MVILFVCVCFELNIFFSENQEQIEKNVALLLTEAQTAAQEALKGEKKMNAIKAEVSNHK